jgi:membrane protease YdiL (CAAX protease family)
MKSYFLGFIGFALTILLLVLISRYLYLRKEKTDKKRILIFSIIGIVLTLSYFYITKYFLGFNTDEKDSLIYTILFTLLITPFFEEVIYRRWILQHYFNLSKGGMKMKYFIISLWIGLAFILPSFIFYILGWISEFSIKSSLIILLFASLPIIIMFLLQQTKSSFNKFVTLFVILVSQAFLFTFGHGVYASKAHIVTGLLYGILYLSSRSIVPPLIAHYTWNILIFLYSW